MWTRWKIGKCPRCQGSLCPDGEVLVCINCGYESEGRPASGTILKSTLPILASLCNKEEKDETEG